MPIRDEDILRILREAIEPAFPSEITARLNQWDALTYLTDEVWRRDNLTIRGESLVETVRFEKRRATGVRLAGGEEIDADTVILDERLGAVASVSVIDATCIAWKMSSGSSCLACKTKTPGIREAESDGRPRNPCRE
jgi:hypothetical protein